MTRVRRGNACSILNFSGIFLEKLDYKIHFRRKLWIDIIPGEDKQADSMIHFYQERDNYLLGLHKLEVDEAANLAALLGKADRGRGAPE
jgi:myosin-7